MRKLLVGLALVGSLIGAGVASADEGGRSRNDRPVVERTDYREHTDYRRPVVDRDAYRDRDDDRGRVEYRRLPPPRLVERVGRLPGYSWVAGNYRRFDGRWVWIPGHYQRRTGWRT